MLKDQKLEVAKPTDDDAIRKLENAIQFGTALLIEDVDPEHLDTSLLLLLSAISGHHISSLSPSRSTSVKKDQLLVRVGDTLFACGEGFRLFITTQHPNPRFPPEATARATLVDFTLSAEALEEQLLSVGVARIHAEVEEQKHHLNAETVAHTQKLTEVEDLMLDALSHAGARFLEDEGLVQSLSRAKTTARDLTQQLAEVEQTTRKLNALRSAYLPLASRAVLLFFVISDLHRLDPMYHFSLSSFTHLFEKAITDELQRCAEREGWDLDLPLDPALVPQEDLISHFTYVIYASVAQSLLEAHKQVFAFVLCARLLEQKGVLPASHFQFMITGMQKFL